MAEYKMKNKRIDLGVFKVKESDRGPTHDERETPSILPANERREKRAIRDALVIPRP